MFKRLFITIVFLLMPLCVQATEVESLRRITEIADSSVDASGLSEVECLRIIYDRAYGKSMDLTIWNKSEVEILRLWAYLLTGDLTDLSKTESEALVKIYNTLADTTSYGTEAQMLSKIEDFFDDMDSYDQEMFFPQTTAGYTLLNDEEPTHCLYGDDCELTFTRTTVANCWAYDASDNFEVVEAFSGNICFDGARRISRGVWSRTLSDGTAISDSVLKGAQLWETRTNAATYSRDYIAASTDWTENGTPSPAANATGVDGEANAAHTLTDNAAGAEFTYNSVAIADDNWTSVASVYVDRDSDVTRFPAIGLQLLTGGTTQTQICHVNTSTCAVAEEEDTGSNDICAAETLTDWCRVYVTATDVNDGNTVSRILLYPARGSSIGVQDNTATGSAIFDAAQIEQDVSFPGPPIFTTVAAVTRNADVLTFPSAGNIDGTVGSVVATVEKDIVDTNIASYMWDVGSGKTWVDSDEKVRFTDGSTAFSHQTSLTDATRHTVGWRWGASDSQHHSWFAGTKDNSTTSFDGDLNVGANVFIGSNTSSAFQFNGTLRDLKLYIRALFNGLMEELAQ